MARPEHSLAPNLFYNDTEAKKYSTSSRMLSVQREITTRAIELLSLGQNPSPKFILDVGCGSGLSGEVLSHHGHHWIGLDISPAMLKVARENLDAEEQKKGSKMSEEEEGEDEDEEDGDETPSEAADDDIDEVDEDEEEEEAEDEDGEGDEDDMMMDGEEQELVIRPGIKKETKFQEGKGDLLLHDMGQGINFRPNSFDGCVSISAVQWLCNAYEKGQIPQRRLRAFFSSLYSVLRRGARAVIQLYPESPQQMEMITSAAMAAGFTGGVVVDYPNSAKAKKFYLVCFAGGSASGGNQLPRALGTTSQPQTTATFERERQRKQGKKRIRDDPNRPSKKSKEWIMKKKDRQRKQGKDVRADSKFSGRRRKGKF